MGFASGLVQPLIELVGKLADKYGTKFIVALGGIGGLAWMTNADKLAGEWAAVGIVLICGLYMIFRRQQEQEQVEVKK